MQVSQKACRGHMRGAETPLCASSDTAPCLGLAAMGPDLCTWPCFLPASARRQIILA